MSGNMCEMSSNRGGIYRTMNFDFFSNYLDFKWSKTTDVVLIG
jgi:hypothetical protein